MTAIETGGCPYCDNAGTEIEPDVGRVFCRMCRGTRSYPATNVLVIYTMYDRPRDYPDHIVIRPFVIGGSGEVARGEPQIQATVILVDTVSEARDTMLKFDPGLTFLTRQPGDDPPIVGSWL